MRILLIGEFSGVHTNLKQGLENLGHDVKLASDGDSYRGFASDFSIAPFKGILGKCLNVVYFILHINYFIRYDVVQFINPFVFPSYYHILRLDSIVFMFNKKKIYYACGTDVAYLSSREKMLYFPFDDETSSEYPCYKKKKIRIYNYFINNIDYIVPAMYDYFIGYKTNKKTLKFIPLPGSGECCTPCDHGDNVTILFGITRPFTKGATYILPALDIIKKKYPNVIIEIVERIPFNDYLHHIENADILIDQCKSYFYGMNAVFALEKGLIVLSGAEADALQYMHIDNCPVINIMPSIDSIVLSLERALHFRNLQMEKRKSVEYVNKYHNPISIAHKFEEIYQK